VPRIVPSRFDRKTQEVRSPVGRQPSASMGVRRSTPHSARADPLCPSRHYIGNPYGCKFNREYQIPSRALVEPHALQAWTQGGCPSAAGLTNITGENKGKKKRARARNTRNAGSWPAMWDSRKSRRDGRDRTKVNDENSRGKGRTCREETRGTSRGTKGGWRPIQNRCAEPGVNDVRGPLWWR